jgi:DNA-binding beta-propeller fold protein YncE
VKAPSGSGPAFAPEDRIFLCNEDSNTLSVINPMTNTAEPSVDLVSFDEDRRPHFRLVSGGVVATHAEMIQEPLDRGAVSIHGAATPPDSRLPATTGRGSSNVHLVDTATREVIGNVPNPVQREDVVRQRLSGSVFVGREPHEATFTRNGR